MSRPMQQAPAELLTQKPCRGLPYCFISSASRRSSKPGLLFADDVIAALELVEHKSVQAAGIATRYRGCGAIQPYPNRWTYHVLVSQEEQIDGERLNWLREELHRYRFSA